MGWVVFEINERFSWTGEGRLEKQEFERLVVKTRLRQKASDMAYRVMVGGEKLKAVADDMRVTRQLVEQAVRRVDQQKLLADKLPDDWVRVSVCLPPGLAKAVQWLEHRAKYDAGALVELVQAPDIVPDEIEIMVDLIAGGTRRQPPVGD